MPEAAFDAHAELYDEVANSALGQSLRARVHQVTRPYLNPHATAVDLGCGTGIDALWLAPQVRSVVAIDESPAMVAAARHRCRGLQNVSVSAGSILDLELTDHADIVLANFGVINCLGPLPDLAPRLASLLRPGAHAVLVTMPRICPLELGVGVATMNRSLLRRRRRRAEVVGYRGLQVQYASASGLAAALGPTLELVYAESLGLVLPPYEQRGWIEDRPRLRRSLEVIDRRLGRVGARLGWGDHHIAVFERPA